MKKIKSWVSDGISFDETKMSALVVSLLAVVATMVYSYVSRGDFTDNLLDIVKTLIFVIAGVNVVSEAGGTIKKFVDRKLNDTNYTTNNKTDKNNIPTI